MAEVLSDSELKQVIMDTICSQLDLDNIEQVQFYTWLIWALGLCNS